MSTVAIPFSRQQPQAERRPIFSRSISLATLILLVTAFACGLGLGRAVWYEAGFRAGYHQGFQEGPIRLQPGDLPDNWTPPPADINRIKDR